MTDLKKQLPLCSFIKKDGIQCQIKVKKKGNLCHIHKSKAVPIPRYKSYKIGWKIFSVIGLIITTSWAGMNWYNKVKEKVKVKKNRNSEIIICDRHEVPGCSIDFNSTKGLRFNQEDQIQSLFKFGENEVRIFINNLKDTILNRTQVENEVGIPVYPNLLKNGPYKIVYQNNKLNFFGEIKDIRNGEMLGYFNGNEFKRIEECSYSWNKDSLGVEIIDKSGLVPFSIDIVKNPETNIHQINFKGYIKQDSTYLIFNDSVRVTSNLNEAIQYLEKVKPIFDHYGENSTGIRYKSTPVNSSENNIISPSKNCSLLGENIWFDKNNNGEKDEFENGINGLKINLYKALNGKFSLYDTQLTSNKPGNSNQFGYFKFCVDPGEYYIELELTNELLSTIFNESTEIKIDENIFLASKFDESNSINLSGINGKNTTHTFIIEKEKDYCNINIGVILKDETKNSPHVNRIKINSTKKGDNSSELKNEYFPTIKEEGELNDSEIKIVHFRASWCIPCRWLEQVTLSEISKEKIMDNVEIISVDIESDYGYELKNKYELKYLPTLLILDNENKVVERIEETITTDNLRSKLKDHLTTRVLN